MNCRKIYLFFNLTLILFLTASIIYPQRKTPADFVDPMIGTSAHGHTYPGASMPFGLVQLSPDTDRSGWDWCSGYHYSDSSIIGFSHTHLSGTGCADYGDILIMPTMGELKLEPGDKTKPRSGYRSSFSHKNETARAGYYSVLLDDYQIKAELTASLRAGFHRYTFLKKGKSNIIIDLVHGIEDKATDAEITFVNDFVIEGYRRSTGWANSHCVYFRAEFSKPFTSSGITEDGKLSNDKKTAKGKQIKGYVAFAVKANEKILVKVGISHTNIEGARLNVSSEIKDWNFDRVRKQASDEWNRQLSLVNIEGKDDTKNKIFYTALYHSFLSPNTFSDLDGNYTGMDGKVHRSENSGIYTVFSLWDTFRALNPLLTIVERQKALELVRTLVAKYEESGLLPVWELAANETGTMIGYHSIPLIADAYFKGIREFDIKKAYEAMKKSAMQHHLGLDPYMQMGYIPADLEGESVSKTLEYAYDDWCIAKMAKELGNDDDYKYFAGRALSYINVFDPSFRLMRPKKNGKWLDPFDPYSVSGNYTEANSWQYSFFVPQDVNNLIKLMGGDDAFVSRLDDLFTADPKLTGRFQSDITGLIGQYAHGNEPSHHMAYLYNYAGAPWKTQQRVNQIVSTLYTDKPDGLCGNEDCGQMSAWYVLSAMGFYSVCPGDTKYVIGTPAFDRTVIKTGKESFVIKAENLSDKNIYIQSASLNGKDYPYSYIDHSDLLKGGELVFKMGPEPSEWGRAKDSRPVSFIDRKFTAVPYLESGSRVFIDSTIVKLASVDNSAVIYYSLDGSDPVAAKQKYEKPLVIKNSSVVKSVAENEGVLSSVVTSAFNKIPEGRSIKISFPTHRSYTGGGPEGLIDGISGTLNHNGDAWQGYYGNDLDAKVDLGKVQDVSFISASFLQAAGSWIFYPVKVEYYVSEDGNNYTKVFEEEIQNGPDVKSPDIKHLDKNLQGVKARYVRVFAKNIAVCPQWHPAAGNKAFLFTDEITIK